MSIRTRKNKQGKITGYQAVIEKGVSSTGKRLRETKTFKTKREAEIYINKTKTDIINGTYIEPSKLTFSQAIDEWFETEVKPRLAPATIKSYSNNIERHIRPALGSILLEKITPMNIQQFYNQLDEQGYSERSIKYIHDNLHSCLKHFVFSQSIAKNPCDFVKVPKKKSVQKSSFYSESEVKQLLKAVENDRLRPVVYLGLMGLRRSEMCALKWSDIDFINNKVTINKNLVVINGQRYIGDCKSTSSQRVIIVSPSIIKLLSEYKRYQLKEKSYCVGSYIDKDLIICQPNGDYINPASLSSQFPKMLEKYGLRRIRLHDLRHTFCSLSINEYNIAPSIVSHMAGHSNTQVTLNTYSHTNEEMEKKTADAFEQHIFQDIKIG